MLLVPCDRDEVTPRSLAVGRLSRIWPQDQLELHMRSCWHAWARWAAHLPKENKQVISPSLERSFPHQHDHDHQNPSPPAAACRTTEELPALCFRLPTNQTSRVTAFDVLI